MRALAVSAACSAFLAASGAAHAYNPKMCGDVPFKFSSTSQTVNASTTSFPPGYWQDGITDTVNKFNRNPSNFRYSLNMDSGGVGRNNGQNEIWGDTGSILSGAPAIAYTFGTCY